MRTGKDIIESKETEFHDKWAADIEIDKIRVDESFEACTAPENRMILERMGGLENKRILDIGCGAGEASVYFAKNGANVTAVDISANMLKVVKQLADKHGVSIDTKESTADRLGFPDYTFDIVYAANLLHHVNIEATLSEIHRVLKNGGTLYSWDPLAHNPIINMYRRIATDVRTSDEHPIKMKDLAYFRKLFSHVEYETTWFFTLWLFIKFYLVNRVSPNKERYWKKIIDEHKKVEHTYDLLEKLDKVVLKIIPFLRRYCWNIVIIARK